MSASRVILGLVLAGAVVVGLSVWRGGSEGSPEAEPVEKAVDTSTASGLTIEEPVQSFLVKGEDPMAGRVGAGLNVVGGTGEKDLQILQSVFSAWRSNAPGMGNPVGNNQEITAALTGLNPWEFAIIPPDHPAINQRGELCDRWGTPLFFHQLSGDRMEIWSNGPDRRRGTDDDVVLVP